MPYCSKCGAEVAEDSKFCPSCGHAIGEEPVTKGRGEKYEKHEKGEKEGKGEKEEKGEGDLTGALIGGLIIILLGSILLLSDADMVDEEDIWAYFLWGIGIILLLGAAWKYLSGFKSSAVGYLIGGLVLCVVGAGGIMGFEYTWALVLIVIGIGVIFVGVQASRKSPKPP